MTTLVNTFEGVTPSGTTLTAGAGGNTGGASGAFVDILTIVAGGTLASDSAHAAHGGLGVKVATGGTAGGSSCSWTTSLTGTSVPTAWFREYLYFTANPAAQHRVFAALTASVCGSINISTAGKVVAQNAAGTGILTSTASIPLNQWFRIEGFVTGDAAVGQIEFKLFLADPDAATATETQTSAATQNTTGVITRAAFGITGTSIANAGPFWIDDVAASDVGYIGPAAVAAPESLPMRSERRTARRRFRAYQPVPRTLFEIEPSAAITTWDLAGTASNTSVASGAVTLTDAVAGTASTVSSATGAITSGVPTGAPTLVSYTETTWNSSGSKSTASVAWNAGDLIVVIASNEGGSSLVATATPTATGLTFTGGTAQGGGPASAWVNTFTAIAGSNGSSAISSTGAGVLHWGMAVWVFRNHGGAGNLVGNSTTAQTISLTRAGNNSLVVMGQMGWPDPVSGYAWTPTVGNDRQHAQDGAIYTVYVADWGDQGAAGTTSYGATGESSTNTFAKACLEIKSAATTWALAGTASNTSTASGTVTLTPAVLAGTASAVSAASGALTLLVVIVGTASNASSATGAITLLAKLAGTASTASSATGALTLTAAIAGTASNVSAATGAFLPAPIAGTAVTVSQASGAFLPATIAGTATTVSAANGAITSAPTAVTWALAGTAANASSASGAFLPAPIAGTASNTSSATGVLALRIPLAGTAANASAASGVLTLIAAIAGTAVTVSTASGSVTLLANLAGTAVTVSSATGAITSAAGPTTWSAVGTASNASAASGTITLAPAVIAGTAVTVSQASGAFLPARIAGSAASVSAASGAITLLAQVAGTAVSVSSASGTLTLLAAIAGTAVSTSTAVGAFLPAPVAGTAVTVSVATGALTLRLTIAGTAVTLSVATGALLPALIAGTAVTVSSATGAITSGAGPTVWSLGGTAAKVSTASGALTLLAAIAGTAASTSTAAGAFTLTPLVIAGTASTVSLASGVLAPKDILAGTAVTVSVASGVLIERLVIAGTAVTSSLAIGILGVRLGLAGSAVTVSHATGQIVSLALAVLPQIIGCVVRLLAYSATVRIGTIGTTVRVQTVAIDHIVVANLGITVEVQ